jgi:DNA-binding transcriptional LysR family regulator
LPELARRFHQGFAGRLALSFVSTADYSILPSMVRRFTAAFPAVELTLTEATSDVQIAEITAGRMDAGVIIPPANSDLPGNLSYRRMLLEPLVVAVPQSWIAERRVPKNPRELTRARIAAEPMILFPRRVAPAFHDLVISWCSAANGSPHIVQEAIQMQTIISLVSAGLGLALVPASLKNLVRTGVRYLDLPDTDRPLLETGLVWDIRRQTPALENLLAIASDEAATPTFSSMV